jgi:hypothetical protein
VLDAVVLKISHTTYILPSAVTSAATAVQPAELWVSTGSMAVSSSDVEIQQVERYETDVRANLHLCPKMLSSKLPHTVSHDMLLQPQASCGR